MNAKGEVVYAAIKSNKRIISVLTAIVETIQLHHVASIVYNTSIFSDFIYIHMSILRHI